MPLDADDLLTPESVESRVKVLLANPQIQVVYGQVRHFAECIDGRPLPLDQPQPAHVPDGMLIRRAAYERVGPFSPGLRVAEALDWLLRARASVYGGSERSRAGALATRAWGQQLAHRAWLAE